MFSPHLPLHRGLLGGLVRGRISIFKGRVFQILVWLFVLRRRREGLQRHWFIYHIFLSKFRSQKQEMVVFDFSAKSEIIASKDHFVSHLSQVKRVLGYRFGYMGILKGASFSSCLFFQMQDVHPISSRSSRKPLIYCSSNFIHSFIHWSVLLLLLLPLLFMIWVAYFHQRIRIIPEEGIFRPLGMGRGRQ